MTNNEVYMAAAIGILFTWVYYLQMELVKVGRELYDQRVSFLTQYQWLAERTGFKS